MKTKEVIKLKKLLNNCIPLIGLVVTYLYVLYLSGYELLLFLALLGIPVISNLIFIIISIRLNGSRKASYINLLSLLIQPLCLIAACFIGTDDIGRTIIHIYMSYILIVDLIELLIPFILYKLKKLKLSLYAVIILILFALFYLWFYYVCYLF